MSVPMHPDEVSPSPLDLAREYTERDWRPFPIEYGGKRPAVGIRWGTATAIEQPDRTLQQWFGRDPVNIGLSAKWSGLTFLDDDTGTADGMEKLCEAYGQPIPRTYRVRTSKGWHWYFRTPAGAQIHNAGKGSYLKDEFGFDVRGNCGGTEDVGGYVVAAGSVHESGFIYEAEDPDAEAIELPGWLLDLLLAQGPGANPRAGDGPEAGEPDSRRPFTMEQAKDYVKRFAEQPLRNATEGGRNNALNAAALVVGHFVPDFFREEGAVAKLAQVAEEIGLDPQEIGPTIRSGLKKGMSEPYLKVDQPVPFGDAPDESGADPESDYERLHAQELRKERIRRQVRAELDAELRPPRRPISERVIEGADLENIPPPAWSIGGLMPEGAVGFLNGRSQSYKSFVLIAMAASLHSGTPVMGDAQFPILKRGRVLYVAGEGWQGAALRLRAYAAAHGIADHGVILHKGAVNLADRAEVDELYSFAAERECTHVFVDTFRANSIGTKENDSTEVGVVIAGAIRARDTYGIATLYADHTGHAGERAVGAEAKWANVDYALMIDMAGAGTDESVQRTLRTAKFKDAEVGSSWALRLRKVTVGEIPSVVIELGEISSSLSAFGADRRWWEPWNELPGELVALLNGKGAKYANDIARLLRWTRNERGLTESEIRDALAEAPHLVGVKVPKSSLNDSVGLLENQGVIMQGNTPSRYVIAVRWRLDPAEYGAQ